MIAGFTKCGADDGSRTHLIGLGSRSSTDELHPQVSSLLIIALSEENINKNFSLRLGRIFARGGIFLSGPDKWRVTAVPAGVHRLSGSFPCVISAGEAIL